MTRPRNEIVSISDTLYYHIASRCVRRSFLCGHDEISGRNYEHRRKWIEDRIRILSSVFAIDICAYAIMSHHFHICVKINPDEINDWSIEELSKRWSTLFWGSKLFQKWQIGDSLDKVELDTVNETLEVYRLRLGSLSWFMKCLNEPIARQANKEDGCTGHFWESRYKSQALLTEDALLSCMAYVDFYPVRAQIAKTPENSEFTSIKERITPQFNLNEAIQAQTADCQLFEFKLDLKPLLPFCNSNGGENHNGIPFAFDRKRLANHT